MDSMVTARMPKGKKETGNSILRELGTNPSQFINESYDYVIKNRSLPYRGTVQQRSMVDFEKAVAFIASIPLPAPSRFAHMTDEEIKHERLGSQGRH